MFLHSGSGTSRRSPPFFGIDAHRGGQDEEGKGYFPIAMGVRIDQATMLWMGSAADRQRMAVSTYVRHLIEEQAMRDLRQKAEVSGGQEE